MDVGNGSRVGNSGYPDLQDVGNGGVAGAVASLNPYDDSLVQGIEVYQESERLDRT
jgi:hypothetical protein